MERERKPKPKQTEVEGGRVRIINLHLDDWETEENRKVTILENIQKLTRGEDFLMCGIDGSRLDKIKDFKTFFASTKYQFMEPNLDLTDAWTYAHDFPFPAFVIYKKDVCETHHDNGALEGYRIKENTPIAKAIFGIIKIEYA